MLTGRGTSLGQRVDVLLPGRPREDRLGVSALVGPGRDHPSACACSPGRVALGAVPASGADGRIVRGMSPGAQRFPVVCMM